MAYGKHQVRVRLRDAIVHSSGALDYATAEQRARDETIKAGVGASGMVYEFDPKVSKTPDVQRMKLLYEARLAYDPSHADGSLVLVREDHTTPPPPTPSTPEQHG